MLVRDPPLLFRDPVLPKLKKGLNTSVNPETRQRPTFSQTEKGFEHLGKPRDPPETETALEHLAKPRDPPETQFNRN